MVRSEDVSPWSGSEQKAVAATPSGQGRLVFFSSRTPTFFDSLVSMGLENNAQVGGLRIEKLS